MAINRGTQTQKVKREFIQAEVIKKLEGFQPLSNVNSISGVRIYDVGQGDAIGILDENKQVVLQLDYGGRQDNPFKELNKKQVDNYMPFGNCELTMLTHWDEDHWCTAKKADKINKLHWLVPRQKTSPRAAVFSATLKKIYCIPEDKVRKTFCFKTQSGDEVWWEKIGFSAQYHEENENCNKTGVAFSVVKNDPNRTDKQVILLPGDSPYGNVSHFEMIKRYTELKGIVAFHHGSKTHWNNKTRKMLTDWKKNRRVDVVFSYALNNSYKHPFVEEYSKIFGPRLKRHHTPYLRDHPLYKLHPKTYIDILF